jgi:putative ABC transport system substrate-binding protein
LTERGWRVGRNLQMEYRAAGRDSDRYRQYAQELLALRPDVAVASGTPALEALQNAMTRRVPIVFANATDPLSGKIGSTRAQHRRLPEFESRFAWKWLELLKQLAPDITRVGIIGTSTAMRQMSAIGPGAAVRRRIDCARTHDAGEIERGIGTFAYGPPHDGLIVMSQLEQTERERVVALAARFGCPRSILSAGISQKAD